MKRFFVLFVFFLCGCAGKVQLNCSYIDNSSILGSKEVSDIISFKNDKIISYKRNIYFNLQSGMNKDLSSVYRIVKLEGKALRKYIGGKYTINRNTDQVSMSFTIKRVNNLKYIGIDIDYDYEQVKSVYSDLGFACE